MVVRFLREQGRTVRAMVHHDDERAEALRVLGAEVVAGDLTNPADVGRVLDGCPRAYFGMSVAASYLEAAATVASVARSLGGLEVLVSISQMTVSQMTPRSTEEAWSRGLGRAVTSAAVPFDAWAEEVAKLGLPPHLEQHLVTMARLHRQNRYDRATDTVEAITGTPAQTVAEFVAERADLFT